MSIIDEYRAVTEQIATLESKLRTKERELNRLMSTCSPKGLNGVSYEERIKGSHGETDIVDIAKSIVDLQMDIKALASDKEDAFKQRLNLERVIEELGSPKKRALMLRIKGKKIWQIAKIMNYDESYVSRLITSALKEVNKSSGEDI